MKSTQVMKHGHSNEGWCFLLLWIRTNQILVVYLCCVYARVKYYLRVHAACLQNLLGESRPHDQSLALIYIKKD